jgi:hypothetical protein
VDRENGRRKGMNTGSAATVPVDDERKIDADLRAPLARAESRAAIEGLLGHLGYPEDWAGDLERQAWERGQVWKEVR